MKNLKKILIILIILAIVIIIIIANLKKENESGEDIYYLMNIEEDETIVEENINLIDRLDYFVINNCVMNYFNALDKNANAYYGYNDNGEYVSTIEVEEIKQRIYNILSNQYIEKNKITTDNIFEYINEISDLFLYTTVEIKKIQDSEIDSYLIYGILSSMENYTLLKEVYLIVNIDSTNITYSIEPLSKEAYNLLIENNTYSFEENKIEANDDNIFEYPTIRDEDIIKEYMNEYKRISLAYPEKIYEKIDKEYREKRFKSIEDFSQYINNNREDIIQIYFNKYQVNNYDSYTQYICIDTKGNYYIFNETSVMQYTIMLDTYIADLPQFVEQYNSSSTQKKVALNINKFIQGINDESYYYTYNLLADSFKNNYYKTQEEYEKYIKENLFTENEIEYVEYSEEGTTYIYEIQLSDATGESSEIKNMTVIMQLKEGTDFIMSFSIN